MIRGSDFKVDKEYRGWRAWTVIVFFGFFTLMGVWHTVSAIYNLLNGG